MEDLKQAIETVRNALFIDEESEAFERIVERLEGYEAAYNTILKSNERLEKTIESLKNSAINTFNTRLQESFKKD